MTVVTRSDNATSAGEGRSGPGPRDEDASGLDGQDGSAERGRDRAARPWSAPGPDADWWRGEPAEPSPAPSVAPSPPPAAPAPGPYGKPPRSKSAGPAPVPKPPIRRDSPPAAMTRVPVPVPAAPVEPPPDAPPSAKPSTRAPSTEDTPAASTVHTATSSDAGTPPSTVDDQEPRPIVVPAAVSGRRPARLATAATQQPVRGTGRRRIPRRPWFALPALVVLGLMLSFFAWVSAEPFWLAVGHGHSGVATVVGRTGRVGCQASFSTNGDEFSVSTVDLAGVTPATCTTGTHYPARMVSAGSHWSYVDQQRGLTARWLLGSGLIALCVAAIAWITGAGRFDGWRRVASLAVSVAAPIALAAGIIAAAY
jgi:hypothetical protein